MRKICSSILLVLLCILLSVSCNKNSELEETSLSNFTQFERVKNKLDADVKVANRRARLRSTSDDETPLILKDVDIDWDESRFVTFGDSTIFMWVPFDAKFNSVLVSNEVDSIRAKEFNHKLSYTTLVRYENISDSIPGVSLYAHIIPSIEYLYSGAPLYDSDRFVPKHFDGQIHLYNLDGNLIGIRQYIDGKPYEIAEELRAILSICFTRVVEMYAGVGSNLEFKGYAYQRHCIHDFGYTNSNISPLVYLTMSKIDSGEGGGGGGGSYSPPLPPPETPIRKDPCGEAKKFIARTQISDKIKELSAHREAQRGRSIQEEKGYVELSDGTFKPIPAIKDGHTMNVESVVGDKKGYIHTHTTDYEAADGYINKPIQIFSDTDVEEFIVILQDAAKKGIPPEEIYGAVITDGGTYILRYGGNSKTLSKDIGNINWNHSTATF